MKKISFLVTILMAVIILPNMLYAQEEEIVFVERDITGNAVWEGEVHVRDLIQVHSTGRLIIKEGTKVYFHNIGGITVSEGTIQAQGRMGKEIVFENTKEAKEKGFMFKGIKLVKVDPSTSYITGCIFKDARAGITCVFTSLKIENNIFDGCQDAVELYQESHSLVRRNLIKNCNNGVIAQTKSSPTITNNFIKNIKVYGIQVIQSSKPIISKNTISQVKNSAIFTTQGVTANISNNTVSASNYGIHSYQVGEAQKITGNHVTDCRRAIYNDGFSVPVISNNHLEDNVIGIVNVQFSSPQIINNDIIGNYQGIVNVRKSMPLIKYNNIIDNDEGFFIDYSAYPTIKYNNIIDNLYAVRLGIYQSSDWEKRSSGSASITKKNAMKKRSKIAMEKLAKQEFKEFIDATNNFWGEDGLKELNEKGAEDVNISFLYDYFDQKTVVYEGWGDDEYMLDRIKYDNWLTSEIEDIGLKESLKGDTSDNPKDITVR